MCSWDQTKLIRKKANGLGGNSEYHEEIFVREYCEQNHNNEKEFRKNILPYIKSFIKDDDILEETNIYVDGALRTFWKLKHS